MDVSRLDSECGEEAGCVVNGLGSLFLGLDAEDPARRSSCWLCETASAKGALALDVLAVWVHLIWTRLVSIIRG